MFFSKKKETQTFSLFAYTLFFQDQRQLLYSQIVMSNYLNTTICFDLYGWHAQKIQKLSNSTD